MHTKLSVGNKIEWKKFGHSFKGVVKDVSTTADIKTWYKIKITDIQENKSSLRRFKRFRVGQNEFNYLSNLKQLRVIR